MPTYRGREPPKPTPFDGDDRTPVTALVTGLTLDEANARLVALEAAHADEVTSWKRRCAQLVLELRRERLRNKEK